MNAIQLYRQEKDGEAIIEYNFYDNQFAPSNLAVRKLFMAMLESTKKQINRLEVEYNDRMIADKMGKRAAEILRFLGASQDNVRENKNGEFLVSRSFISELTEERYNFFYELVDLSDLLHFRLKENDIDRVVFYFSQYLMLRLPIKEEALFYQKLEDVKLPIKVISIEQLQQRKLGDTKPLV